jgi:hypothetical protein
MERRRGDMDIPASTYSPSFCSPSFPIEYAENPGNILPARLLDTQTIVPVGFFGSS